MAFRVNTHRSLYIDDYILLAGLLCLCPATAILYKYCDTLFLGSALLRNPSLLLKLDPGRIKELLQVTSYFYAFMALIWTTIFTVKFSFLAFFKKLIERVTKIHTYYWIVVVITVLTWPFMVVAPFIVCRHFVDDPRRVFILLNN
jgi:predicted ferric reductase